MNKSSILILIAKYTFPVRLILQFHANRKRMDIMDEKTLREQLYKKIRATVDTIAGMRANDKNASVGQHLIQDFNDQLALAREVLKDIDSRLLPKEIVFIDGSESVRYADIEIYCNQLLTFIPKPEQPKKNYPSIKLV